MKKPASPESVNISVGGDVSGQIIVGSHNLAIGGIYGGIVNFITPGKQPVFTARAKPVYLRPRAFPGLLDREDEQKTAVNTLRISESLSISGEDGIGKTALMRYLAYNSPGDNFPDGIIYLSAQGYSVDDLREYIFDSFFEGDTAVKPTDAQLSRALQGLRALILLDDLSVSYADANQLINSVPQSNFIFGSSSRCLWGEGGCIELGGLPVKEALILLERELGHSLDEQDKLTAETFCREINGNPLKVLQAGELFRHGMNFTEMTSALRASHESFVKNILDTLTPLQRQTLFPLAVANGHPIPAKHLAALCQNQDLESALKKLIELKLIQSHSPAYSLTGTLALSIGRLEDLSRWQEYLLNYFVGWIKQNPPLPDITDALDLTLNLLEKANKAHRWDEVIALGRGVEKTLCLVKRWSAWLRVLELIFNAAKTLGNRTAEGWALHQLGTRELCLGNHDAARQSLTHALNIRKALGDKAGAAVTRHNLNLIIAPPAPPRDTPRSGPKPAPKSGGSSTLKLFLTITTVAVVAVAIIFGPEVINPPNGPNSNPVITTAPTEPPPTENPPTQIPSTKIPPTKVPPTIPPTITITPSLTPSPCRYGIWYCEDFNDRNAAYWDLSPAWSIQSDGNNYLLAGSGHEWASLTNHEWGDFRVRFDLRISKGTIHLNYRIMPVQNGIVRYYVGVNEKYVYLQKSGCGGGWMDLTAADYYVSPGNWHPVEIAGWGNHIAVYIDYELVMQYVDNDAYLPSGSIAFETLDDSKAQIDNIEVMEAGDEPQASVGRATILLPEVIPVICTSTYMTWEENTDRPGMDYWSGVHSDPIDNVLFTAATCQQKCYNDSNCMAFTYNNSSRECWLKNGIPAAIYKSGLVSGIRACQ